MNKALKRSHFQPRGRTASETGLGVALMHKGRPVALESRALTQTERGYAMSK